MLWKSVLAASLVLSFASAHTVLTYPPWRGDNLFSNGTVDDTEGLGVLDIGTGGRLYPYGMQWMYPCGGMPISTNRTKWPVKGGAVAFQPGWFTGHSTAFIYINLGLGTIPQNLSLVMLNGVQIIGPTRDPYPGTFCFPQVPLPAGVNVQPGDNATIQIIELAAHGAGLYNCADITFAEPEDVPEVNETNCFNSSQLRSELIFTTESLRSSATMSLDTSPKTYIQLSIILASAMFASWLM
ncbi:hypothetical protein PV10_05853 [Exophiala mesophila]|uniref:Copper acquisition factor BIM1-like domain-containing protein n=1 Tax=Exophiala mesophila TaxID=212818 RepID=A0A0D1Z995_EXOME|nr:uncharacterized protein PV10_05853 [Exophiala mesophila]KIV91302.1 hypothetical protein PV10_05853 [Exophiala mesophila]